MIANSRMVASHGGSTSGVCTPSMNQNIDSSYSRRSSLKTDEYAYSCSHPSAPGGVVISNGLGNRCSAMESSCDFVPRPAPTGGGQVWGGPSGPRSAGAVPGPSPYGRDEGVDHAREVVLA